MPATRAYPLALLLGGLAACGFAPLAFWPLTLACLGGLIALLERAGTMRRALASAWWFGLGHFCVGNNWIATAFTYQAAMPAWLGWIAVVLLALYLACFPALGLGAGWWLARRLGGALPIWLAAGWIAGEWLRATAFTGFAWNPLGAIWAPVPVVPAATTLVGTYGLSGLTILIVGRALAALRAARSKTRVGAGEIVMLAVPLVLVAGGFAVQRFDGEGAPGPRIRVVQPNINQAEKWQEDFRLRNETLLKHYTGAPTAAPRLILWPEAAVPDFLEEEPAARARLARLMSPRDLLLTGGIALRHDASGEVVAATNSLFGLDAGGHLLGRYDKAHLVPYGEYLPMRPLLSRIGLSRLTPGDMDFDAGPGPRDVLLPGIGRVGVQICYEIIFSGNVIDAAHRPRFLFNPSNDAWFGAWGPPQHLAQARLRAIEEAMPIVRATPTGISAVIDARGRLLAALPWRTAGAIEMALPAAAPPTPFARFGNALPLLLAFALTLLGFATRRRGR